MKHFSDWAEEDKWQRGYEAGYENGFRKGANTEVVFCEQCKWFGIKPEFDGVANWGDGCRWFGEEEPNYDDYCSYGEAKGGD